MATTRFLFLSPNAETMYSTPALQIGDIASALKNYQGVKTLDDFQSACRRLTTDDIVTVSDEQLDNQDTSFDGDLYLITADHPIFVEENIVPDRELCFDEKSANVYLETWFDCRRLGLQLDMDDSVNVYAVFHYPEDTLRLTCLIHYGDGRISKELFYGSLSQSEEQFIRGIIDLLCKEETGTTLKKAWEDYCLYIGEENINVPASECTAIRLDTANVEKAAADYLTHLLGREIQVKYALDGSETLGYWGLWVDSTQLSKEEINKVFDAVEVDHADRDSTDFGVYPIRELCRGVSERILTRILPFKVDYSFGLDDSVYFYSSAQTVELKLRKETGRQ